MKNIDVIGKIVDTQGTYDEEGNELTAPTYRTGFYVQTTQVITDWADYLEDPQPTTFTRTYAGGVTPVRYVFADEAEFTTAQEALEVAATQGWTPKAPVLPSISPVEFKLLFTATERIAIRSVKTTDDILHDFMTIIEDPRLTLVNLNLKSVQEGIDYLVMLDILTPERAVEVKTGEFT
jgi:hypothetical protein